MTMVSNSSTTMTNSFVNAKSKGSAKAHPIHLEANSTHESIMSNEKNLVLSFAPASYDLGAIDGLRTLACLTVMAFHAFLYWGALMPLDKGFKVTFTRNFVFDTYFDSIMDHVMFRLLAGARSFSLLQTGHAYQCSS